MPTAIQGAGESPPRRAFSAPGEAFLDYVERHPEALERRNFTGLERHDTFYRRLQAWPTLVEAEALAEMGRACVEVLELVRSLPRRLLDNDPMRLAECLRLPLDSAFLMVAVMEDPATVSATIGRADFIAGPQGFKCIEFNMSGSLGGWNCDAWAEPYLGNPLLQRFFAEQGLEPRVIDPARAFFTHVCGRAKGHLKAHETVMRIAVPTADNAPAIHHQQIHAFLGRRLEETLARLDPTLRGEIVIRSYSELKQRGAELHSDAGRVHAVIEQDMPTTKEAFSCWMAGSVDLYNGVLSQLLGDKRLLALLSEHQDSDLFSAEERRTIRQHVPWTRLLQHGETRFDGRSLSLVDTVLAERQNFILKPASAFGGTGVTLGLATDAATWKHTVEQALSAGDWIVQEHLPSFPLLYQHGERGCKPHDLIWGLFVCGADFGGLYLRMQPSDSREIVNVSQGAVSGVCFEV